ncbi:hypothetical protein CASFOL_021925 [Castilleja foliolosa]|uniref:F-box domain-containing protein n=1 Tax=Castilleja foliolosa TaxID=1961234 RepID=A0ABD3D1G4_9LAMI
MNKRSVKRRSGDDDGSAIAMDRLSQLPQPILHIILSLISQKDAIRTCVLSKSWRYLWHGRLNFELSDHEQGFIRNKKVWSFIDKTLQRYLDQNFSLQKFKVDIYHQELDSVLLQKWIPVLIMNMGVRSFSLSFHRSSIVFPLPLVVFQSESLVELHLQRCNLNTLKSTDNVMLNNLQTLRLHFVDISDEIFEKIISGCPLIENLELLYCISLKSIKLCKHHNIKDFGCSLYDKTTIIEIENIQILESVRIRNCGDWFLCHRNTQFPHLKSLNLHSVKLPAKTFDNFSSFFPCLSELVLDSCHGLKEFRLFSSSIKRLTIKMNPRKRMKAFIDTPNILYFKYSDNNDGVLPSIKFTTTSNEWKSKIALWTKLLHRDNDATPWFLKLNKLLKGLSQSHITLRITLYLIYKVSQKLHINDSYGGLYKPVVVEHLKLRGCHSSYFDPTLLNGFFRICRPRFIHMNLYGEFGAKCDFAEYISKLLPDETGCYFGLQDLEEVSIEIRDMKAKEWHCVKGTSLPALRSQHKIRFRLTWKEQLSKLT